MTTFQIAESQPEVLQEKCPNPFCVAGIVQGYHYVLFPDEPERYRPTHDCTLCDGTGLHPSVLAFARQRAAVKELWQLVQDGRLESHTYTKIFVFLAHKDDPERMKIVLLRAGAAASLLVARSQLSERSAVALAEQINGWRP